MERKTIGQMLEERKPNVTYNLGNTSLPDLQEIFNYPIQSMSRDITQMEQDYRNEMGWRMIRMLEMDALKQGMLDGAVTVDPASVTTTDTITIPSGAVLTYTTAGQRLRTTTAYTNEDGIAF